MNNQDIQINPFDYSILFVTNKYAHLVHSTIFIFQCFFFEHKENQGWRLVKKTKNGTNFTCVQNDKELP